MDDMKKEFDIVTELNAKFAELAEVIDRAHRSIDTIADFPAGPGAIDARVELLVSKYRGSLAKIEYLKGEFAKLAAYVKVQSDEIHRGQRIIGELLMTLDAQNRKRAAEKLLN